MEVRLKAPFNTGLYNIDNALGLTQLNGASVGESWPVDPRAVIATRLRGCITDPVEVTLTFDELLAPDPEVLAPEGPVVHTYLRGDAKVDGAVNIADALFIAQYLAGVSPGFTDTHFISAARVKEDGAFDVIAISDVLFIAQQLVGIRDICFALV